MRTNRNYPEDHRVTHIKRKSSRKEEVVKAFSESWRDGKEFSIKLRENGSITIRQGIREVAFYRDAEEFARAFMPEALK